MSLIVSVLVSLVPSVQVFGGRVLQVLQVQVFGGRVTPVMLSLSSTFLYLTAAPSGSYVSSNVKQDDLLIVLLKVVFPMWTVGHSSLSWKYMFYVYILLPKFSEEEKNSHYASVSLFTFFS